MQSQFLSAAAPTAASRTLLVGLSLALAVTCAPVRAADRAAPECAVRLAEGGATSSISQFQGKILYVDFWASWCGPCLKSFPFMNELQHELGDKGLQILAINMDEKPDDAAKFLAEHPASFKVALSDNAPCATDFNVQVMPSTYLVDRNGSIRHVHLGFRPGDAPQLRALIEQLLAENPAVP